MENSTPDVMISKGNVFLFYAFDIGDEIDLQKIKKKQLVNTKEFSSSPYFKNYHTPLFFDIESLNNKKDKSMGLHDSACISSKLHQFGVLSFYYKIPFKDSLDDLKAKLIEIKKKFDSRAYSDGLKVFERIKIAIKKPKFFNLDNFYFAIQVDPQENQINPEEYKKKYGARIASLLRLETFKLSAYQEKEILFSTTGYSGQDMVIIDSEGAFIYDKDYFESLEFFEFANIQQLELQYFDRLLDKKLNFFYLQKSYKVPIISYIPLLAERSNSQISLLGQLRVDISVITERLENSIKMAGETYYMRIYSMLREKMGLIDWKQSIKRKLEIVHDLYSIYQNRLDVIHGEILEVIIIILIFVEVINAFWG